MMHKTVFFVFLFFSFFLVPAEAAITLSNVYPATIVLGVTSSTSQGTVVNASNISGSLAFQPVIKKGCFAITAPLNSYVQLTNMTAAIISTAGVKNGQGYFKEADNNAFFAFSDVSCADANSLPHFLLSQGAQYPAYDGSGVIASGQQPVKMTSPTIYLSYFRDSINEFQFYPDDYNIEVSIDVSKDPWTVAQ